MIMAEWRKCLIPKSRHQKGRCEPLEKTPCSRGFSVKGQQVAVGDKGKTALPLLIWWLGSEGRAVLTNVLCMFGDR